MNQFYHTSLCSPEPVSAGTVADIYWLLLEWVEVKNRRKSLPCLASVKMYWRWNFAEHFCGEQWNGSRVGEERAGIMGKRSSLGDYPSVWSLIKVQGQAFLPLDHLSNAIVPKKEVTCWVMELPLVKGNSWKRSSREFSETHPSSNQQPEEGVPGPSAGFEQCDWLVSASFPFDQQRLAAGHQSSTLEAPLILFHPLATSWPPSHLNLCASTHWVSMWGIPALFCVSVWS